jgi:hypothetical protein
MDTLEINRFLTVLILIFIIYFILKSLYKDDNQYPKTCWIFWNTEKLPPMIHKIKKYNASKLKNWDVRFLNSDTIYNYISKEEFPSTYDKLIPAHKADWIRLQLLHKYGGCWMDASIILNQDTAIDKIYDKSVKTGSDLTVFTANKSRFTHKSGKKIPLHIDNWLILAPKNSKMIKLWLDEYTSAVNMGLLKYKENAIKNNVDISKILFLDKNCVYLTQHICIQYLLQKKILDIPPILFLDASQSMFKVKNICKTEINIKKYGSKLKCIENKMNHNKDIQSLPYIKLTRAERSINIDKLLNLRN